MKLRLLILLWLMATRSFADISVNAAVDSARVAFGESITLTVTVNGTQASPQVSPPKVDGLNFAGPAVNTSMTWVNGQVNQSVALSYQVTPARVGEFVIPALEVAVGGKVYRTDPIRLTVDKPGTQPSLQDTLFARVRLNAPQVYLGQTAPLDVILFARADTPLRGLSGFNAAADGLNYKFHSNVKTGNQVLNGQAFNLYLIEGAIAPTQAGMLKFGPAVIKVQLATQSRSRNIFEEMMGRIEVREVPVSTEEVPIEVLPLPVDGRPADFGGAIGQWNLALTAQPTTVAVGDPITVTVKLTGTGNIDTVPPIALAGLDNFKTYDPTTKTTKNELNTTGERVFQQVLIPKDLTAQEIPAVRLTYFDPVAKAYKTTGQGPIRLAVTAGNSGSAIVTGSPRVRPAEKLGQDIVYLKGDLGPAPRPSFFGSPAFWLLNGLPLLGLAGALGWKWRADKLAGDIAYARRSRAAKTARRSLAQASDCAQVQRVLQDYLGDRLNIPSSGITGAIVDERGLPPGVRDVFTTCDAARFAGAATDLAVLKRQVEELIDELENAPH